LFTSSKTEPGLCRALVLASAEFRGNSLVVKAMPPCVGVEPDIAGMRQTPVPEVIANQGWAHDGR
jgi:hypothetical protein